jgi:hypothetical protein
MVQRGITMMVASLPSSLDSAALARRLAELAGEERAVQVEFLLHLDEFDRRRAYVDAGYDSLWEYCLRALHLREGAAGRRIGAMRVLRRFPVLAPELRDGRLCMSTASLLGQVLTEQNLVELVARAAYRTKAEVEELVVSIKPRPTPAEGVRRLPTPAPAPTGNRDVASVEPSRDGIGPTLALALAPPASAPAAEPRAPVPSKVEASEVARASACEVRPVAEDRWSVRVTLDAAAKANLDALRALLSHKIADGDVGAVVRDAIRCALEKYGKRRGAIGDRADRTAACRPRSKRGGGAASRATDPARLIPAAVRREVWRRDGERCTFVGPDGHRCESRWQLQFDHLDPVALAGGKSPTADDLRLRCRPHNLLEAERVFGREHMDQFRRDGIGRTDGPGCTAREPEARYAA